MAAHEDQPPRDDEHYARRQCDAGDRPKPGKQQQSEAGEQGARHHVAGQKPRDLAQRELRLATLIRIRGYHVTSAG
jgi:hypothetical protein